MPTEYFILSSKHTRSPANYNRGVCVWWAPDSCGYVYDLNQAGRYSEEEACEIETATHNDNIAVPCDEALASTQIIVSDSLLASKLKSQETSDAD